MITKKHYQKYLLVLFYYPPELVLLVKFLKVILGVFQMFYIKCPNCH